MKLRDILNGLLIGKFPDKAELIADCGTIFTILGNKVKIAFTDGSVEYRKLPTHLLGVILDNQTIS